MHKNMKPHKVPPIYNLTDDDMERIDYQYGMSQRQVIGEATRKQVEQHQKVQESLVALQHLLDTMNITVEKNSREGISMSPVEEAEASNPFISKLVAMHIVLEAQTYAVEFLTPELQEQMKTLSHMNILVSHIPIQYYKDYR
jgi:hypothetical protein